MDAAFTFIKENDEVLLYVIFGLQCCVVFLGYPLLIRSCTSEQKRQQLSYGRWTLKWTLVTFVAKWMLDTYDLVDH